jgi:hypothetical protein
VTRNRTVIRLGRALADHDLGRYEALSALAHARPRRPQRPPGSQACGQFSPEGPSALDEECLIDGFVTDPHGFVIRKVYSQSPGDLLRTPCLAPSTSLSLSMTASAPGDHRARNNNAVRSRDRSGEPFLNIDAQGRVQRKLGDFRAPSRSLGVPLGCRCTIFQAAAARRGVAPELTGDGGGRPTKTASDLAPRKALNAKKRDLLTFRKREISSGGRIGRRSEHRW